MVSFLSGVQKYLVGNLLIVKKDGEEKMPNLRFSIRMKRWGCVHSEMK